MKEKFLLALKTISRNQRLLGRASRSPATATIVALLASGTLASQSHAQTMTFEGLKDQEAILNYYNGGLGGNGSGPGPNYGISFGANALATIQDEHGGTGNVANLPSGDTCAFFLTGAGDQVNVANGFKTGFSFYYCAINDPGSVQVYSGLNDTGTLLATLVLPVTPEITPAPDGGLETYDNWVPIGVSFTGTAESVNFSGTANQIGFDNITINSATPGVPEPASLSLISAGGLLALRRRRVAGR